MWDKTGRVLIPTGIWVGSGRQGVPLSEIQNCETVVRKNSNSLDSFFPSTTRTRQEKYTHTLKVFP